MLLRLFKMEYQRYVPAICQDYSDYFPDTIVRANQFRCKFNRRVIKNEIKS